MNSPATGRNVLYISSSASRLVTLKPRYVNMADINSAPTAAMVAAGPETPGRRPRRLRWDIIELLFFAYRDFVGDPDHVLEEFGFGRAHHRVMHFVHRYPGLNVADLLDVLRITKQSLGRVLKQLLDEGLYRAEGWRRRPASAPSFRHRERRGAGGAARGPADRPHQTRAAGASTHPAPRWCANFCSG